jgi:hypothetical protein
MTANENRFTSSLDLPGAAPGSARQADEQSKRTYAVFLTALFLLLVLGWISLAALVGATQALGASEVLPAQAASQADYFPFTNANEQAQAPVVKEHIQEH